MIDFNLENALIRHLCQIYIYIYIFLTLKSRINYVRHPAAQQGSLFLTKVCNNKHSVV